MSRVVYTVAGGSIKFRPPFYRRYRVEFNDRNRWFDSHYSTGLLFKAKDKADWFAQGGVSARVVDTWKEEIQ